MARRLRPDLPADFDGRIFTVPMTPGWRANRYVVIFEVPALNTSGDSGREIRCRVIPRSR